MQELPTYTGEKITNGTDISNLNFAAVLLCKGKIVQGVKANPARPEFSVFVFEPDDEISQLQGAYKKGDILVEPKEFIEQVRYLKDLSNKRPE